MAAILTALGFCLICSLILRAPMALLYIVGFPLLLVLTWLALIALSPTVAIAVIVLGLTAALTSFFESRGR